MNDTQHGRIDHPYHAWLAPIAAYAAAILMNILMFLVLRDVEKTRAIVFVQGLVPFTTVIAFHVFGYVKSIQCLSRRRSPKHGIAGLIVNSLSIGFLVLMTIGMFRALDTARQLAQQQANPPAQSQPTQPNQ